MKRLIVLVALLAIVGSAQAATVGTWTGGAGDGGLWSTGTNWTGSVPPAPASSVGDEIKMQLNSTAVIDSTMSYDHNCRLTIGDDSGGIMTIQVTGGLLGANEVRVGAVRNASQNGIAEMYQSNGTVTANQLILGRCANSATQTSVGSGLYVISGGRLISRTDTGDGRMYIGSGVNSVVGSDISQQVGKFVVDGALSTISMKTLYVGSDGSTKNGTGTVEFKIGSSGVSKIALSNAAILDGGDGSGIADLVLTATAPLSAADILLVETTSTTAVSGIFDRLNGVIGAATQGASVTLGGNAYTLSYLYDGATGIDGNGNDIALVYVPEPATLAILGLGGLLLRRRLA